MASGDLLTFNGQEPNKWDLFAALWHHFSSGPGGKDRTCTNSVSIVPVAILFIGLTAEPYHTHAIWYWMMNTIGIFRIDRLDLEDLGIYTDQPHYFWLGEVGMSAMLAGVFAVPPGSISREERGSPSHSSWR